MISPDKENCCGCSVCKHICPRSAITMHADAFGFLYPVVNNEACIDCGLCEKVCPFNCRHDTPSSVIFAYAARHKNHDVIKNSRSGGVFTALTDSILKGGGVIYGATLSKELRVEHTRAVSSEERNLMRGSKYSQSYMGDICRAVKQDLKSEKIVIFSGTPCLVDAIKRFVGPRLEKNLITLDVICHGIGSPMVWKKFIQTIENIEGKKIVHADFRDKSKYGWNGLHKESFLFKNDLKRKYYPYIYYNDLHIRECCGHCPYSSIKRCSDITLGDLWGFEKVVPEWSKENNGISLVLVNSEKGMRLFDSCRESIESINIELSKVLQPHLLHPLIFDESRRKEYSADLRTNTFDFVLKKYHKVERLPLFKIIFNKIKTFSSK